MELRLVCAAVVLLCSMASSVLAGDKAQPVSPSTLEAMGLPAMKTLSDSDGAVVRGKFTFAFVSGSSTAGGVTNSFGNPGTNPAFGFRAAFAPLGGGSFGVAFGGAFSWSN
jgi:hypothetical protein